MANLSYYLSWLLSVKTPRSEYDCQNFLWILTQLELEKDVQFSCPHLTKPFFISKLFGPVLDMEKDGGDFNWETH